MHAFGSRDEVKNYLGHGLNYLTIAKDGQASVYLAAKDMKRVSEIIQAHIKNDATFSAAQARDCVNVSNNLVEAAKKSASSEFGTSREELFVAFQSYSAEYIKFNKFMAIPVAIEKFLTASIEAAVKECAPEEDAKEHMTKLMTAPEWSEFQKEQIDLLKLAIGIKQNKKSEIVNLVKQHADNYRWISCYNIDEASYEDNYFVERHNELQKLELSDLEKQLNSLEDQIKQDQVHFEETLEKLKLPEHMVGEIQLLRQYVYLRTYRVEMQTKANYYIQPLFKKISTVFGLPLSLTVALSPKEIETALADKASLLPSETELTGRTQKYGLRYDENGLFFVVGNAVDELEGLELGVAATQESAEAKGVVAFNGTAQGIARVVFTKEEIKNFKQGEILVTTMTTPEFVPAMKKAAAIVTNEGGVLCHAAIMARELKVPCVISTVRATSVFKTGDILLVDAMAGIVKKV